jgi:crossover junction endodeoxyribonuclease RuvC
MRILGVDPGTITLGYGVIDSSSGELTAVSYGAIKCKEKLPLPERLSYLYDKLNRVIDEYHPDVLAVESPFVADNAKSALAIGKAQAVAILAAAQRHIPVFEYTPRAIKSHVADYGASSKEQMQEMVKFLLGLDDIPQPNDAADALAVAICHCRESQLRDIMAESE